jgi:hypothetical protein
MPLFESKLASLCRNVPSVVQCPCILPGWAEQVKNLQYTLRRVYTQVALCGAVRQDWRDGTTCMTRPMYSMWASRPRAPPHRRMLRSLRSDTANSLDLLAMLSGILHSTIELLGNNRSCKDSPSRQRGGEAPQVAASHVARSDCIQS